MFRKLLALAAVCSLALGAGARPTPQGAPTGRMIVKFRAQVDPAAVAEIAEGCGAILTSCAGPYHLLTGNREAITRAFYGSPVEYVEPETVMRAFSAGWGCGPMRSMGEPAIQATPNDPYYPQQWGLAAIRTDHAHDVTKGEGTTVAVIDTGIRPGNDLAGTKIAPGRDFVNNDADATDDNGHGTHVAGTIAQTTNNGIGCAGVAPATTLLPVKVLAANGAGSNFTVAQGIRWAADNGAQVINLSLGGGASQTLLDAVRYAVSKGCVIVAAAGNSGAGSVSYPAAYPECIAVGAVDKAGRKASFSQYGAALDIVAPGVGILQQAWSKAQGHFYGAWNGTSMATPHVAGVCALVRSRSPLPPRDLAALLARTAKDLGPAGRDNTFGHGQVDATAALNGLGSVPAPPPSPTPPAPVPVPADVSRVLELVNAARAANGVAPLSLESRLTQAAQGHSDDMARRRYFSHYSPEGTDPGQRIRAAGYPARTWGENIAAGQPTADAVMTAWMNSSGHRRNILNPAFKELGLGVTRDASAPYRVYWCQTFGSR